jgi:hypothetical protein
MGEEVKINSKSSDSSDDIVHLEEDILKIYHEFHMFLCNGVKKKKRNKEVNRYM